MITLEQAKALRHGDIIHDNRATNKDGTCYRWRVNGKVKTWKRTPERLCIPVKRGMWEYSYLTEKNLELAHLPCDCPRWKPTSK